ARGRAAQAGLDDGCRFGDGVLGALPAEDVVVRARDPQDGAADGAPARQRQVAQEPLVAAGDLARQLLLLGGRGVAGPQVRVAEAAAADAELADVQGRDLVRGEAQRADEDVGLEVL